MKLLLLSDLHFEMDPLPNLAKEFIDSLREDIDGVALVGDICHRDQMPHIFRQFCSKFKNVFYVPGNHEFAFIDTGSLYDMFWGLKQTYKNLFIFDNEQSFEYDVDNIHFFGGTMWYRDAISHYYSDPGWFDFRFIPNAGPFIWNQNEEFLRRAYQRINKNTVVLTHMLPSFKCVHPRWAGASTNSYFVCDMEDIIMKMKPKLWAFGHTHSSMDFMIGQTRMVCNPRGYNFYSRNKENPSFNNGFIIEV